MPWSSSPRFAKGALMKGLLTSHVFDGDGRFFDQVALLAAQKPRMSTTPTSGSSSAWVSKPEALFFVIAASLRLEAVNLEGLDVFLRPLGIELHAVEQRDGRFVEPAMLDAELLHRRRVEV